MKYFSTNKQSAAVDFKEAAIRGQAPDKGLYFPEYLPMVDKDLIHNIEKISKEEIAFRVIRPYVGDSIPENDLRQIAEETVNFEFPLVRVNDSTYALELFHGPTLAFKDVGARFMSRCLGYFSKERTGKVFVLVATSGDTGGAVANGFYGVDGVEVIILYPSGKVSAVQEKQLTTLGKNIHAVEVEGSFDDCQKLVKMAFADAGLSDRMFLTSANSINVARWLPQQFYYFFAWQQWAFKDKPPVIAVPSGNFGNICAGLLAYRTGLPVKHFIAACNANDIVPRYFETGDYLAQPAKATISNAMDVGDPSNFVRMLELFDQNFGSLKGMVTSYSISDQETKDTLVKVKSEYNYLPDPHGAVAFRSLEKYLPDHPDEKAIVLETAHPVKFHDVVEPLIGEAVPLPDAVREIVKKEKTSEKISGDYDVFKALLLKRAEKA